MDWHYDKKLAELDHAWHDVVLQAASTLDPKKPGDPSLLVEYTKELDQIFHEHNSRVLAWLEATWSNGIYKSAAVALWPARQLNR